MSHTPLRLNALQAMFKNSITIQAERDLVTFTTASKSVSFSPYLHLDDHSVIVSIGEPPPVQVGSSRVDLFQEPTKLALEYGEVLAAFLRHGIFAVSGGGLLKRRPSIAFRIDPEISTFLRGYHQPVFTQAALQAGALPDYITFTA